MQSVPNGNKEWLVSGRLDYSFSDKDKIFARAKFDRGLQPTYTDSVNPAFNDSSNQPQDEGQLNYTHLFSPNVVNNFIGSVLYTRRSCQSGSDCGPGSVPRQIAFVDGSSATALGTGSGNPGGFAAGFAYPQGRHVTQWQIIDDLSVTKGNHSFKMGVNFRRDDVSDYASETQTQYPAINTTLLGFANDQVNLAAIPDRLPRRWQRVVQLHLHPAPATCLLQLWLVLPRSMAGQFEVDANHDPAGGSQFWRRLPA